MPRVDSGVWLLCPDISSSWHKMAQAHMMSRWAKECIKDSSRERRWHSSSSTGRWARVVGSADLDSLRLGWKQFKCTFKKTMPVVRDGYSELQWTRPGKEKYWIMDNFQVLIGSFAQPMGRVVNLSPKGKYMPIRIRNLEPLGSLCADDLQNTESWSCHGSSAGSLP